MKDEREETIRYIKKLLSFKDLLWLKLYHSSEDFLNTLAYYIEPHYFQSYNISVFNFVENKDYGDVLEQYYTKYIEYEMLSEEDEETELIKGIKSKYRNYSIFRISDITIPDKFKPFISIDNYLVEKFPIPMSIKDDFVYFLFCYLKQNLFLVRASYKIDPWFLSKKQNKYYKDDRELLVLSDYEIIGMYKELRKYSDA